MEMDGGIRRRPRLASAINITHATGVPYVASLVTARVQAEVCPARVLILGDELEAARSILARVYPIATPLQLGIKVEVMVRAVKADRTLDRSSSLQSKLDRLFRRGSNRRALGTSHRKFLPVHLS